MKDPERKIYPAPVLSAVAWAGFLGIVAVAIMLSVGCTIPSGYVAADRMTYDAIAPGYKRYVIEDPVLSEKEERRRIALVESWEARLEEAEKEPEEEETEAE